MNFTIKGHNAARLLNAVIGLDAVVSQVHQDAGEPQHAPRKCPHHEMQLVVFQWD